jgi:type I restriction enzyme S subunit
MKIGRLGDHATFLSGFAFKSNLFNDQEEGMPIIRIRDVVRGRSETYYSGEFDERYLITRGDYLIGMDGEFNLARWDSEPALLNQRVCKIDSLSRDLDRAYLGRFLPAALKKIEDATPFVTVKHLSVKALNEIEIPLPPLADQKRVAAILDKADAVRRKLQQSLRLSDDFLRSVFLDMFGDPEGLGWESTTVEELASAKKGSIRTGPFGSQLLHSEFVDEGVAVLGIDNAVRNKFAWGQPRFITEEKYEDLKRYTVHPGDVLITIMGTCGRCAIVPQDIPKAINTKHLCCITLNPKKCLPEFLHSYFLLHPMAKSYLGQSAKGAIMDGLNGGLIKSLPVPIVPIALQREYAQLVKNRTKLVDRLTIQAAESEALFSSLQQRAFRGEL